MKKLLILAVLWLGSATAVMAQDASLRLRLSRDMGTGLGSSIQGRFSMHVDGPADLARVLFLIDGESVAEQTDPPYRYTFHTDAYSPGNHTLSAIGYTADGQELGSNSLTRTFLTGSDAGNRTLLIIIPLLVLVIGGRLLTSWWTGRGRDTSSRPALHAAQGGAICPKCHKPFARHWWAPNLVTGKFDRCPHCGKWSLVGRAHPDLLQASYDAVEQAEAVPPTAEKDDEAARKRRLDNSRFSE